jgi:uncharacterized membrane protein YeaQ/YmgE (transglycosylase-associated protein family)
LLRAERAIGIFPRSTVARTALESSDKASPSTTAPESEGSHVFHLLWMLIVGIVVGAIARWIMPGAQAMGLLMTGLVGIAGSFIGGFIARLFSKPADGAIVHPAGLVLSVVGALILLFALQKAGF